MKILVIEDDPLWQKIFKLYLENLGDIHIAKTMQEVEYYLHLLKPDLVIADIHLGQFSMLDYFIHREDIPFPILFTTGFLSDDVVQQSAKIPYSLFISKPVERLTLESSVLHLQKYFTGRHPVVKSKDDGMGLWSKNKFNQSFLIPYDEIIYLKGEGNYCFVQTARRTYPFKKSLVKVLAELPTQFTRISKFIVVNTGLPINYRLVFNDLKIGDFTFRIGRNYRKNLLEKLSTKLES